MPFDYGNNGEEVDPDELNYRQQMRDAVTNGHIQATPRDGGGFDFGLPGAEAPRVLTPPKRPDPEPQQPDEPGRVLGTPGEPTPPDTSSITIPDDTPKMTQQGKSVATIGDENTPETAEYLGDNTLGRLREQRAEKGKTSASTAEFLNAGAGAASYVAGGLPGMVIQGGVDQGLGLLGVNPATRSKDANGNVNPLTTKDLAYSVATQIAGAVAPHFLGAAAGIVRHPTQTGEILSDVASGLKSGIEDAGAAPSFQRAVSNSLEDTTPGLHIGDSAPARAKGAAQTAVDSIEQAMGNGHAIPDTPITAELAKSLHDLHVGVRDAAPDDMVDLYHGTTSDSAEKIGKDGLRKGSALTTDPETARLYAMSAHGTDDAEVVHVRVPRSEVEQDGVSWVLKNAQAPTTNESDGTFIGNARDTVRAFLADARAKSMTADAGESGHFRLTPEEEPVDDDVSKVAFGEREPEPDAIGAAAGRDNSATWRNHISGEPSEVVDRINTAKEYDPIQFGNWAVQKDKDSYAVFARDLAKGGGEEVHSFKTPQEVEDFVYENTSRAEMAGLDDSSLRMIDTARDLEAYPDDEIRDRYQTAVNKSGRVQDLYEDYTARGKPVPADVLSDYALQMKNIVRFGEELYERTDGAEGMAPRFSRAAKQLINDEENAVRAPDGTQIGTKAKNWFTGGEAGFIGIPGSGSKKANRSTSSFTFDMLPFDDIVDRYAKAAIDTSAGGLKGVLGTLEKNTAGHLINPSLRIGDTELGQVALAYNFQEVAQSELRTQAIERALKQHINYKGQLPVKIDQDGLMDVTAKAPLGPGGAGAMLPKRGPNSVALPNVMPTGKIPWQDVFAHPDQYLNPKKDGKALAFIADFNQVIGEVDRRLELNGLQPISDKTKAGFYVPNIHKSMNGTELDRMRANPRLSRVYDFAAESFAAGNKLSNNPLNTLDLFLRATDEELLNKQFSDYLEPRNLLIDPKQLLDDTLVKKSAAAIKTRQLAQAHLNALKVSQPIAAAERQIRADVAQKGQATLLAIQKSKIQLDNSLRVYTGSKLSQGLSAEAKGEIQQASKDAHTAVSKAMDVIRDVQNLNAKSNRIGLSAAQPKRMTSGQMKIVRDSVMASRNEVDVLMKHLGNDVSSDIGVRIANQKAFLDKASAELSVVKKLTAPPARLRTLLESDRQAAMIRLNMAKTVDTRVKAERKAAMDRIMNAKTTESPLFGWKQGDKPIPIKQWRGAGVGGFVSKDDYNKLNVGIGNIIDRPNTFLVPVQSAANTIRQGSAGFDLGATFIQGLNLLGQNPLRWADVTARSVWALVDPALQAKFMEDHAEAFKGLARNAVPVGDSETFQAMEAGQGFGLGGNKGKVIEKGRQIWHGATTQTFGRAESSYGFFQTAARAYLWEGSKMGEQSKARWINELTGGLNSHLLGVHANQRAAESLWLGFSPRLMRSTFALVYDALGGAATTPGALLSTAGSAVRGYQAGGVKGAIFGATNHMAEGSDAKRAAFRSLGQLMTGATLAYVAIGYAMGKPEKEIKDGLNPLNGKKFLSYQVNGGPNIKGKEPSDWIGIGGQVRAVTQLMAEMAISTTNDTGLTHDGNHSWANVAKPSLQDNPLLAWYNNRGAVGTNLIQAGIEAGSGGKVNALPYDNVDNMPKLSEFLGKSLLPMAFQGVLDGQGVAASAAGAVGLRSSAETPGEVQNEFRAQSIADMVENGKIPAQFADTLKATPYNDLPSQVKKYVDADVATKHPESATSLDKSRRDSGSVFQTVADRADVVANNYTTKSFEPLFNKLNNGEDPKVVWDAYDTAKNQKAGELKQVYGNKEYQDAIAKLPMSDTRRLENAYDAITTAAFERTHGAMTSDDWDNVATQQDSFKTKLAAINPDTAAMFNWNLQLKEAKGQQEGDSMSRLKAMASVQLKPYYALKDSGATPDEMDSWLHDNSHADVVRFLTTASGTPAVHSIDAVAQALNITPKKPVHLSGASTVITPQSLQTVQQYGNEIEQLISLPSTRVNDRGQKTYPITQLRQQSALYDALYFWLGYSSADKATNTVPVYHVNQVKQFLTQWGDRSDKAQPRQAQ